MSTKALKTQLLAAIAMVLVASIALGSSTYAWFASNNKVTATGMEVQAQAEGGIEIAYTKSTETTATYQTSATAGVTTAAALAPTSTLDTSAWYHASAQTANASKAKDDTRKTLNLNETAMSAPSNYGSLGGDGTVSYYMVQNFNIRSTTPSALAKGLTVDSVSVAGNTADMSKALRVAIKLNTKVLIYNPISDTASTYDVYSGYTAGAATKAGTVNCIGKDTATLLADTATTEIPAKGTTNNGGVDVQVYVYFEGEDTNLYTDAFKAEGLKVTVNFSATV